jgi:sortase A
VRRFSCAARWFRLGEIALLVIGVSLLGWALAATLISRVYQARQERAFFPDLKRIPPTGVSSTRVSADPLVLGRIEIPRIGVTAIVREGDDNATLAIAVGHIFGTARPGERGNMALAGHRDSFFRPLRHIRREDRIRIVTPSQSWEYVVDSMEVVDPEDTRVLDPTSDTVLTLVTCFPFKYVGHAPRRFIVRASLAALPPVVAGAGEVSRANGDKNAGERTRR